MNFEGKKLVRNKESKMICGVCGGIGEYLSIDPTVIRILWIVLSFASVGMGILMYFIVAVVMPDTEDRKPDVVCDSRNTKETGAATGNNDGVGGNAAADNAKEKTEVQVVETE